VGLIGDCSEAHHRHPAVNCTFQLSIHNLKKTTFMTFSKTKPAHLED
jgi:hypothetical protein